MELLNGNYGGTPTKAHQHSLLEGIKNALPNTEVFYKKACVKTIHSINENGVQHPAVRHFLFHPFSVTP